MAVLPIVRMGNPVLRTPAAPVPLAALAEPATQQWIDDMIETMHDADGVGLAAPQVGVAWQLFVYQAEDDDDPEGGIALAVVVNPMVEPLAGEQVFDWEGCLSVSCRAIRRSGCAVWIGTEQRSSASSRASRRASCSTSSTI